MEKILFRHDYDYYDNFYRVFRGPVPQDMNTHSDLGHVTGSNVTETKMKLEEHHRVISIQAAQEARAEA